MTDENDAPASAAPDKQVENDPTAQHVLIDLAPFPVPLAKFADSVIGTPHFVWTGLLRQEHKGQSKTVADWHKAIDALRDKTVKH